VAWSWDRVRAWRLAPRLVVCRRPSPFLFLHPCIFVRIAESNHSRCRNTIPRIPTFSCTWSNRFINSNRSEDFGTMPSNQTLIEAERVTTTLRPDANEPKRAYERAADTKRLLKRPWHDAIETEPKELTTEATDLPLATEAT
jgi:hypothetical protein